MKQHIKKLSILVTLVFATIFSGCEAEKEYTSKNSLNQNYKLRSVSFSEFKSNRSAFQKLREAREKKNPNILYRGIYNEDYGVFIDTTNIIVIENDGKHSITFQIIDETFSNKIENLVLNSKEDGGYVAYITKYLLSEQEIEAINNGNELLSKKPDEIIKLETNNTFKLFFDCISTIEITTVYCKDDKGNLFITEGNLGDCPKPSHVETTKVYVISADCLSSGGGSDGGGNPDGGTIPTNPNSSGGGGSNDGSTGNPPNNSGNPSNPNQDINDGNNPIITTPVLPGKSTPKPPCEHLKNQSIDNPKISAKIDSLKQRVLPTTPNFDTKETMVNIERYNEEYHIFVSNNATTGNGTTNVTGSLSKGDVARIHNHPINTLPIFSHVDIVEHFDAYNFVLGSRKNEFTDYLVNFNNTTYALRMENIAALTALFQGLDLNTEQGKEDANEKVFEIFQNYGFKKENNPPYTQAMAEELFMNVVNDPKMGGGNGITLYRKDDDGWGKLVKNGNTIQKTPCN